MNELVGIWKWIAVTSVGIILGGGGAGAIGHYQMISLRDELKADAVAIKADLEKQIESESSSRDAMIATLSSQIGGVTQELRDATKQIVKLQTIIDERIPPRR